MIGAQETQVIIYILAGLLVLSPVIIYIYLKSKVAYMQGMVAGLKAEKGLK